MQAPSKILLLQFLPDLFNSRLYLRGGEFRFNIGSAVMTQHPLGVPAGSLADPVRTFRTLLKVRLGGFNRLAIGLVVSRALDRTLNLICRGAYAAQKSAENIAHGTNGAACHTHRAGPKFRDEAVPAAIAEKLKLITLIRGMVSVVSGELNETHTAQKEYHVPTKSSLLVYA